LLIFRCVFHVCNWFPYRNKVTFLVTFGQNSMYVYKEMLRREPKSDIVFLYKKSCPYDFEESGNMTAVPFETFNILRFFQSIYHLATSRHIIVDNYFGCLSVCSFRDDVECIQLWHAAGAVKYFGLKDQSVPNRCDRAKKRFLKVYRKFNKVVVGSEEMARVFTEAFDLSPENILRTGIPRTDLFYDEPLKRKVIHRLKRENPLLKNKKVLLYAPTFRDHQLDAFELKLDLDLMERELAEEYVLLLRLHPAVKSQKNFEEQYKGFVYDYSSLVDVNELLLITDCLITDYSSIPYEFSLLNRPMIFFAYDLEQYQEQRGLWDQYESLVPGPIVKTTEGVVEQIQQNDFDYKEIQAFSRKWNRYSVGQSSRNIVNYVFDNESEKASVSGNKTRTL
ncbi:MAG TPA: CDP-glycerol glycerophosphotransferase family protein, partial [Bacillales bacterium]|nr:CDP-glycerol glycerophosphotransferase family protein [Bacillales bacterium]